MKVEDLLPQGIGEGRVRDKREALARARSTALGMSATT